MAFGDPGADGPTGSGGSDGRGGSIGGGDRGGSDYGQFARAQRNAIANAQIAANDRAAADRAAAQQALTDAIMNYKPTQKQIDENKFNVQRQLGYFDDVSRNPLNAFKYAPGMIPGVNVQAYEAPNGTVSHKSDFGFGRLAGDVVGMGLGVPWVGDLAQKGIDSIADNSFSTEPSTAELAAGLQSSPSLSSKTTSNDDNSNEWGGPQWIIPAAEVSTPEQTVQAQEQQQQELVDALLGRKGYTRAGQGIVFA